MGANTDRFPLSPDGWGAQELPAVPPGARELLTPAWRFWVWAGRPLSAVHMVYITAIPENFLAIRTVVGQMLTEAKSSPLLAIRQAVDPGAVEQLNRFPEWTGKAFALYLPDFGQVQEWAEIADAMLADRSFTGPPALRARPFGGRSGMVFFRAGAAPAEQAGNARSGRLNSLLGGMQ